MLVLLLLAAAPDHLAKANALLDHEADAWSYELARPEIEAALAAAPDDDAVHVAHARWLRREGQLDAAAEAIKAVRERSPSFVPAMVEEGELSLERDCTAGGVTAHRLAVEALSLSPEDSRAWLLLARTETNSWGPAFELVRDADQLRRSGDVWVTKQAEALLADVYEAGYHQLNAPPMSERCWQQFVKSHPRRPDPLTGYAIWLLHRGRYQDAAVQASRALQVGVFPPAQKVLEVARRKQAETPSR